MALIPSPIIFWLSLLITTALAQNTNYYNQSGIGSAGPHNSPSYGGRFADAARSPLYGNNVSFPGFNFSVTPDTSSAQNIYLSSNWTFQINYTAVTVSNASNTSGNTQPQVVSDIVYDLVFPDGEPLPNQNSTDWTMCGHFLTTPFPSNLTSRFESETGNCSATLGADCLEAYRQALLTSSLHSVGNTSCPALPYWKDIPECASQIGTDFTMVSTSLMNWVPPANISNIGDYNGPYYGLNSTQPFFYQSSQNYNQNQTQDYTNEFARGMRMAILTFQPSREYLSDYSGAVSRGVRFVCGRADSSPMTGAATAFEASRTLWLLCGVVVILVLGL